MKIVIPTLDGKLCAHFGHCETFTFVEVNPETNEIKSLITDTPKEGVSCQSASWIAMQGADIILAGGMGGRPMMIFEQSNVKVISGCPELEVREVVELFLNNTLVTGENSCGHSSDHACHSHGNGHHCSHH